MSESYTVWHAFYDLLRKLDIKTVFGNPGSTEQTMLKNFPSDFEYVFGLQEATVMGLADGFTKATRKPAIVSLHTCAGTGNSMGNLTNAFVGKAPIVILAGQQTREMLLGDPMLANRNETVLPQPYVKWSYQPVRAIDVPGAIMRAITVATQEPAGPVYVSVPYDDWEQPFPAAQLVVRDVGHRQGPDPARLAEFAERIQAAKRVALVYGQDVDRNQGWHAGIALAEKLQAPVFIAPFSERAPFPETHALYKGPLPAARGPISAKLQGFDLVVLVGAQVFRYYPYVAGDVLAKGTNLLQISCDPDYTAGALVGDSLLSDERLALEGLIDLIKPGDTTEATAFAKTITVPRLEPAPSKDGRISALDMFGAAAAVKPSNSLVVMESPSNIAEISQHFPATTPESYFVCASGGLGWAAPAAVGLALAQKRLQTNRTVLCLIGDGSIQYSIQSIYTAVQKRVTVIFLIPRNEEYAILKEFAELTDTPNVPALDLPGLDSVLIAQGYGCAAHHVGSLDELQHRFKEALARDGPTLIEIPISRDRRSLVPPSKDTLSHATA